ncbi:MAG: YccF domain-containing protein [Clostridiaceae bacterium]
MSFLGNIIWFIFGGFIHSLIWFLAGCIWSITLIGIPVGKQCFKLAGLQLAPFGKDVYYSDVKGSSFILNILWLIFGGFELALANVISGILFSITIIGIPFGKQCFKLAAVSLMPFGARIVKR